MRHFCTYFDFNYLIRGIAVFQSLKSQCPAFRLWVLCLDDRTYRVLQHLGIPEIGLVRLSELEAHEPDLVRIRPTRSLVEYYFTLTPVINSYLLQRFPQIDMITYLDSDLFFFGDIEPLFREMADDSIAIIAHRFPPSLEEYIDYGIYNVGWLSFRRDSRGMKCLAWWRERCIEWCYDRVDNGRFADQKYLDQWPALFDGVKVLQNTGANLAPWNVSQYEVRLKEETVLVDDGPLLFYHFHGLRRLLPYLYDSRLFSSYGAQLPESVRKGIYIPYISALAQIEIHLTTSLREPHLSDGLYRNRRLEEQTGGHTAFANYWIGALQRLVQEPKRLKDRAFSYWTAYRCRDGLFLCRS